MITLRVEIMTAQRMTEEDIEEPEGWADMTSKQRRTWCDEAVSDMRNNYVSTSYSYPGDEED
jgi:hypothetical protein